MRESKKRVVLITGGGSGIGYAMAMHMSKEGSTVIICGRSPERLADAQARCPDLITISCDITCAKDRQRLVDTVSNDYPDLNMLINNAGIMSRLSLTNSEDLTDIITNEWNTNYFAPIILAQDLLPVLVANQGTIVNVCSALSYVPISTQSNYCATKAALMSMTQSMRMQYEKVGVKVVGVYFPEVDTPFQKGYVTPRAISPQKAAADALRQMDKGNLEVRVKRAKLIHILHRLMPERAIGIINTIAHTKIDD